MRILCLVALIALAHSGYSQKIGINFAATGGAKNGDFVVGGQFTAMSSPRIPGQFGFGIGALGFPNDKALYIPIYAAVRARLSEADFVPILDGQIGYGAYNNSTSYVKVRGGLYFNAGAGIMVNRKKKVNPYFLAKYQQFQFKTLVGNSVTATSSTGYLFLVIGVQLQ